MKYRVLPGARGDSRLPIDKDPAKPFHFDCAREVPASLNMEQGVKCCILKQVSPRGVTGRELVIGYGE